MLEYSLGDPWPGRTLVTIINQIVDNPDLTAIVKALTQLKPAKVKALRKQLEKS